MTDILQPTLSARDVKWMTELRLPRKYTISNLFPEVGRMTRATSWPYVLPATPRSLHARVEDGKEVRAKLLPEPLH